MSKTLFITIDTEEDDWARYRHTGSSVENVYMLPELQSIFDRFGAIPTYLVNWPVVMDERARAILLGFLEKERCEIGMHCHPWNTPPFEEEITSSNTMLCNLPSRLVRAKLTELHQALAKRFGVSPVSFRAGRWGMSGEAAECLLDMGCVIDTSVTPLVDWSEIGGPDYRWNVPGPYRFHPGSFPEKHQKGRMIEVPATIGFLGGRFETRRKIHHMLMENPWRKLRITGILNRLGLQQCRWLSPEMSSAGEMIRLADAAEKRGIDLNMFFHSTTLVPGTTPFVKCQTQREDFLERIAAFIGAAAGRGYSFAPLSRAEEVY